MSTPVLVSVLHNLACLEHRHLLSQHCAIYLLCSDFGTSPTTNTTTLYSILLPAFSEHSVFIHLAQCCILLHATTQPTTSDSATVRESSSDLPVTWCQPTTHDRRPSTSRSPVTRLAHFELLARVAPAEIHRMSYSGFVLPRRTISAGLALSAETSFSGVS